MKETKHARNEVRLELVEVDVQRTIKPKRGGDRRDNLCNKPVQVRKAWRGNIEVFLADIVNSLVINLIAFCQRDLSIDGTMNSTYHE